VKAGSRILVALTLLLVASGDVLAQSSVDSRVQRLEETVQALERRIASLEAQLREQSTPTRAAPGKENWRKLQNGMSEGDVEKLLGSPSHVSSNQVFISWRYDVPSVGYVEFNAKSRKVESWIEP